MKLKYVLCGCCLSLATVLAGCSMAPSTEPHEDVHGTTGEEISQETTQTESDVDRMKEELKAAALLAYQKILKEAPSIEGEHEELEDASFDYEQNKEMFGNHYDMFAISDINQDGIPELIALSTINFRWALANVYTYADGKAVLLKESQNVDGYATFDQKSTANGVYITYICEENHIHSVWRGINPMGEEVEENSAYAIVGTNLSAINCTVGESENTIYFSDIAKPNVSENVDAIIQ